MTIDSNLHENLAPNERDTVGKISSELKQKELYSNDVIETGREVNKDFLNSLLECVKRGLQMYDGDFFVSVLLKREKIMDNVLRNYFIPRRSCPTPHFDQSVWHYKSQDDCLEYLWSLPCEEACLTLKQNMLQVVPEEHHILQFVLDYYDGTLDTLCKKLNGEFEPISHLT